MIRCLSLLGAVWLAVASGCSTPVPTYPLEPAGPTLAHVAASVHSIESIEASGSLTMTRDGRGTVTLDVAIVAQAPDSARLKAWKLGRSIVDVVVLGNEAWFKTDRDLDPPDPELLRAGLPALFGDALDGATIEDESEDLLVVRLRSGPRCVIDRPTRTIQSLVYDEGTVEFDRYHLVDDRPWPRRIRALSDDGRVTIRFQETEINGGVASAAFRVPRGAVPIE